MPVLYRKQGHTGILTLSRPEARNCWGQDYNDGLLRHLDDATDDDDVRSIILTGDEAGGAFSAGANLRDPKTHNTRSAAAFVKRVGRARNFPSNLLADFPKPVIGAVNGPTVTGGLELALHCDFLVASERARFGDTHARVGVVPGWGLSVLLPQAVGVRRAKEMSLTGRFLTAQEALACGLVNHVVPHDELLPTARALAVDIVGAEQDAARALLAEYKQTSATTVTEGLEIEGRLFREWSRRKFDPDAVERRRQAIVERGRSQTR